MGLVERVRRELDPKCLVGRRLHKDGCKVLMTDAPSPRLIVDFDKTGSPLARDETRCDYLLVAEGQPDGWVAPLELKRGRLHADQAARQLQAGASVAEQFIPQDESVRFRPVAVSGSVPKHERQKLRNERNMIRFHGRMESVRLMSCGTKLVQALHP